jgi:hypothetical protein
VEWNLGSDDSWTRIGGLGGPEELRLVKRSTVLASGTLACPSCDAPVSPGGRSLSPAERLSCPFCTHAGRVRDFLSLAEPTRPAHVVVRVVDRGRLRIA